MWKALKIIVLLAFVSGLGAGCHYTTTEARAARWLRRGDYERALKTADMALLNNPDSAEAYLVRGIVRYSRGDLERAEDDFLAAFDIAPDYTSCWNLGLLYGKLNRPELMRAYFDGAIACDDTRPEAYQTRGMFELLNENDLASAEADFRAARARGGTAETTVQLARTLWLGSRCDEAIELLNAADAKAPEWLEYAWFLAAVPDGAFRSPARAREIALRVSMSVRQANVYSVIAQSYAAEGDWRGALAALKEAERLLADSKLDSLDRHYYAEFLNRQHESFRRRQTVPPPDVARRQLFLITR